MKVIKILNNNALLAIDNDGEEYVYLANGIGFANKINTQFKPIEDQKRYKLSSDDKKTKDIEEIDSKYIEISSKILSIAEVRFKEVDEKILLPLADHIAFAIERIQKNMDIVNPFKTEIQLLFPEEFEVAKKGSELISQQTGIEINEDEISYITLHIHSAISSEHVSLSMQIIQAMNKFIKELEAKFNIEISNTSLAYARFTTHMRYMVARIHRGEHLDLDMDEYTKERFPVSYENAKNLINRIGELMKCNIDTVEIGYLALHIERITKSENKKLNSNNE